MKLKFLTVLAIAGFAFAGCGSNKNDDGTTDSVGTDTTMNSPTPSDSSTTDTTASSTTNQDTTATDSAGRQ